MYDISSITPPPMPTLGKGTECIKLLASQISPDMRQAIVPMMFPALATYVCGCQFEYADLTTKELCGLLGHLVSPSGMGKGQLTSLIDAILRKIRQQDDAQLKMLVEWQKTVKTKGANKEKPQRPDVFFRYPPSDCTSPAFLQNAMACELAGGYTQFYNMHEVEQADQICGSHKKVSSTIRNIFDRQRAGALRATADGVTGNPILRVNMQLSSTEYAARLFYKNDLHIGTFGRIPFSYKPRQARSGKIPRQGRYDEQLLQKLDAYILRLEACRGHFVIPQLNKLADKLAADLTTVADLADDDDVWDMSKRAIINAWKAGCVMWILNGHTWTKAIGELVEWMAYHDIWSKMQVFGDMLKGGGCPSGKRGPRNMLVSLGDTFTEADLEALRLSLDKPKEGTLPQLRVWMSRGFITYSAQTGLYTKSPTISGGKARHGQD